MRHFTHLHFGGGQHLHIDDAWNEGEHPREEGGKFTGKGGGKIGAKAGKVKAKSAALKKVQSLKYPAHIAAASEWLSRHGVGSAVTKKQLAPEDVAELKSIVSSSLEMLSHAGHPATSAVKLPMEAAKEKNASKSKESKTEAKSKTQKTPADIGALVDELNQKLGYGSFPEAFAKISKLNKEEVNAIVSKFVSKTGKGASKKQSLQRIEARHNDIVNLRRKNEWQKGKGTA